MDTTKKLLIEANSTSLSNALKAKADSAIVMRLGMQLNPAKIRSMRKAYEDLIFKINTSNRSLVFFKKRNELKHESAVKTQLEQYYKALQTLEYPQLLLALRLINQDELNKSLQLLIIGLLKYYQTSEQMPADMIGMIADRIIWKFGGLCLEDIAVCFNMAMNGDFGKVYNRIDGGVIMSWLHSYKNIVGDLIYNNNVTQHADAKGSIYKDYNTHRNVAPKRLGDLL